MQDAGLLCRTLTGASPEGRSLVAAIGEYETRMRDYGFAAVKASMAAEAEMGTRRSAMWRIYRHLGRGRARPAP